MPEWVILRMRSIDLDHHTSLLLDYHPDGTNKYFVYVLDHTGKAFHLHVDKDDNVPVETEDVSKYFFESIAKNKQRPWKKECVAWEYFEGEMIK